MGAKESTEMVKVRKLVMEKGMTAYAAVAKVGNISRSAVYMSGWYKTWRAKQGNTATK